MAVRAANDGGTRTVSVSKDANAAEIIKTATDLFFPKGDSKHGLLITMASHLATYGGIPLGDDFQLGFFINERKLSRTRLYLMTKKTRSSFLRSLSSADTDSEDSDSDDFVVNSSSVTRPVSLPRDSPSPPPSPPLPLPSPPLPLPPFRHSLHLDISIPTSNAAFVRGGDEQLLLNTISAVREEAVTRAPRLNITNDVIHVIHDSPDPQPGRLRPRRASDNPEAAIGDSSQEAAYTVHRHDIINSVFNVYSEEGIINKTISLNFSDENAVGDGVTKDVYSTFLKKSSTAKVRECGKQCRHH